MVIIDASAAIEMCLGSDVGKRIARDLLNADQNLVAPEILPLEVIHGLRKQRNLQRIDDEQASEAFKLFCLMPIQCLSHSELLQRMWILRNNMTAYDASYVALAERLNAPIWTCDRKYENTPTHTAKSVCYDPRPIIVTRA